MGCVSWRWEGRVVEGSFTSVLVLGRGVVIDRISNCPNTGSRPPTADFPGSTTLSRKMHTASGSPI